MSHTGKRSKRYFYRVVRSVESESENVRPIPKTPAIREHIDEIVSLQYSLFRFSVYTAVLFLVLTFIFFSFLTSPIRESSPSYSLIYYPASAAGHLGYLEWLVTHYRLDNARREIEFIQNVQKADAMQNFDAQKFSGLVEQTRKKEDDFRKIVDEYAYWHATLRLFPGYRDGLYRSAQLGYMLFNSRDATEKIEAAVRLDPQFSEGREVYDHIRNEGN